MKILLLICITYLAIYSHANELMDIDQHALEQTQKSMLDQNTRQKYLNENPAAMNAHKNAEALAGSEANVQEMYKVSSQIMQQLMTESGGDADKVQQLLEQAKQNPAAFLESLNKSNQGLIRKLANDIESIKPSSAGPNK